MHKSIIYTIHDRTKNTKKELEEFNALLDKGYMVMDQFSYKNEYYYVLMKHEHEEKEPEDLKN